MLLEDLKQWLEEGCRKAMLGVLWLRACVYDSNVRLSCAPWKEVSVFESKRWLFYLESGIFCFIFFMMWMGGPGMKWYLVVLEWNDALWLWNEMIPCGSGMKWHLVALEWNDTLWFWNEMIPCDSGMKMAPCGSRMKMVHCGSGMKWYFGVLKFNDTLRESTNKGVN